MIETEEEGLRFLDRVNFFGQVAAMDRQGRIVIPPLLRGAALPPVATS